MNRYSVYRNNTTGRLRAIKCKVSNPFHTDDETMVAELDEESAKSALSVIKAKLAKWKGPKSEKTHMATL